MVYKFICFNKKPCFIVTIKHCFFIKLYKQCCIVTIKHCLYNLKNHV